MLIPVLDYLHAASQECRCRKIKIFWLSSLCMVWLLSRTDPLFHILTDTAHPPALKFVLLGLRQLYSATEQNSTSTDCFCPLHYPQNTCRILMRWRHRPSQENERACPGSSDPDERLQVITYNLQRFHPAPQSSLVGAVRTWPRP